MRGVMCGVWVGRRRVASAAVGEDGRVIGSTALPRDAPDGWCTLLSNLDAHVGLDYELVLPDWLARDSELAQLVRAHQVAVWVAPAGLVHAIATVARLGTGPPARTAAMIARLPQAPTLRPYLRRLRTTDRRQLNLL